MLISAIINNFEKVLIDDNVKIYHANEKVLKKLGILSCNISDNYSNTSSDCNGIACI